MTSSWSTAPPRDDSGIAPLRELLDALPAELARQIFTHSSWTERRAESYERLAFLGDSVLSLAITTHLFPRLEAEHFGAGRLTKIRAQTVSGAACSRVADQIDVRGRLAAAAPKGVGQNAEALGSTERVLASVLEAIIGACYLEYGFERVAPAVVAAFAPEIDDALAHPVDFKSSLQERLARRAKVVTYDVLAEDGPPHARRFTVSAEVDGEIVGKGAGRSKKDAEQEAARTALEALDEDDDRTGP